MRLLGTVLMAVACARATTCEMFQTKSLQPIEARDLGLACRDTPAAKVETGEWSTVQTAMGRELPDESRLVFVMANGANRGKWFSYTPGCALALAKTAKEELFQDYEGKMYLHDAMGTPVTREASAQWDQLACSGRRVHMLLEMETWVWPGIHIGYEWQLEGATFITKLIEPKLIFVRDAATHAECDQFVRDAPAAVPSPEKHYSPGFENYRTSESAFLGVGNSIGNQFRKRSARLARLPTTEHCEFLQLVKYTPGKWYKPHQDYFHGYRHLGSLDSAPRVAPNRHATLFYYLNDDFEGGETVFPKARGVNSTTNGIVREGMPSCSRGLAVSPVKGAAALFYSQTGAGVLDPLSEHGGCPPVTGVKYGANAFMWNQRHEDAWPTWSKIFSAQHGEL